eukprot:m51a1_g4267 putative serine threonine kinase (470) ;mRNA; f:290591-292743
MAKYQPGMNLSHTSLEGFIAGRLLTMAVSRSLEQYEWPLTRATLIDTIFRDIRTFKLFGSYELGPYGDGVGSTDAPQTEEDWCNQGAHQVFLTSMDMSSGKPVNEDSWSFKFSGCTAPVTTSRNPQLRAIVGFENIMSITEDDAFVLGLSAAINAHNSDNFKMMAMTPITEVNASEGARQLRKRRNELRQDFEKWVSFENQQQMQFEGFFVGKFLSAVFESMNDEQNVSRVNADRVLRAIYQAKYFKIDDVLTVGPFHDETSGERLCNQGMDTVYVTQWSSTFFDYRPYTLSGSMRCGFEFFPIPTMDDGTDSSVILSTAIPCFAVVCSLLISAVVIVQRRGRSTLKKIKRSELEIGERIGKGQFGTVHNGDWHGTPVAIRVVEKTAITREDLESVRSEMELTHSLQHPNLLMLLGYSESKADLLVVSEYMASGSLHEYLKKNKQNMNYYNEIAIAFVSSSSLYLRLTK